MNKKKNKHIGNILSGIAIAVIFLVGLGIFAYPAISDAWNSYRQQFLISRYQKSMEELDEADYDALWLAARQYNEAFDYNDFSSDAYYENIEALKETPYWSVLNIHQDGMMGYLSIPKIRQKIPIYHGSSEDVLQKGVGHLCGTKLPIGGKSNHTVLSAHRGLPSAKLFTDLDQLVIGDRVFVYVLNGVLIYEVDQILPMIDKNDVEALSKAMQVVEGEDYLTMLTCTPYGVNSHRLLVRGHRIYDEDLNQVDEISENHTLFGWRSYYMLYVIGAIFVVFLVVVIYELIKKAKNKIRRR